MLTPASAHAYAGGTAPGVLPGTIPPEEQTHSQPSGVGTETDFSPDPAVIIGLSEEVKGQLDRWFGPEPESDDGILPEEVKEAAEDPFNLARNGIENSDSDTDIELNSEEQKVVNEMAARDAEVRAHENAHIAAAGGLAGAPSFSYQIGPDGKRYATGGSVKIDMSKERTPEETLKKADRIRAAALAPAEPSAQDAAVASKASQMASDARAEIAQNNREDVSETLDAASSEAISPWDKAAENHAKTPTPGSTLSAIA